MTTQAETTAPLTIGELRDALIALCDAIDPATPVVVADTSFGNRDNYVGARPIRPYRRCAPPIVLPVSDRHYNDFDAVVLPHLGSDYRQAVCNANA